MHNIPDLNTVIRNGANMIGIHAVYPDRIKYLKNEEKYLPIIANLEFKEELPIALFEIDSIRDLQNHLPKSLKQALLFERKMSIKDMIETCEIYNIKKDNLFIQLQHRVDKDYIEIIKNKLCSRIIATIGLFQKDFKAYLEMLNNILNKENDYILLDLSKHQPDLINNYIDNLENSLNKMFILKDYIKYLKNNSIPIIIADDTTEKQMREYLKVLKENDINVEGIDMQNNIEQKRNEQKYQIIENNHETYQIKIRKSPTLMYEWSDFWKKEII